MTSRRSAQTEARRRQVLDHALALFSKRGFDKTTVEEICRRSGTAHGSVYHHFKSKEAIAAELCLDAIRSALDAALEALRGTRTAATGIRAVAGSYLIWVAENPDFARFMIQTRERGLLVLVASERAEVHRKFAEAFIQWAKPYAESGELPTLHPILYWATVMGPSDYVARRWLDEPGEIDLYRWARILGDTAARSLGL